LPKIPAVVTVAQFFRHPKKAAPAASFRGQKAAKNGENSKNMAGAFSPLPSQGSKR
jgi:hypothetical protein